MSLLVMFDSDEWPDAPCIGGIAWHSAQAEEDTFVVPPELERWAAWLDNYGSYGDDGRGIWLYPSLGGPRCEGDDPDRDRAELAALARAFPAWRAAQPNPDAWEEWEQLLTWAAEHNVTPYIHGR